ncbi:hypothetical protein GCM10008910_08570 [Faecalicatena orotica]
MAGIIPLPIHCRDTGLQFSSSNENFRDYITGKRNGDIYHSFFVGKITIVIDKHIIYVII